MSECRIQLVNHTYFGAMKNTKWKKLDLQSLKDRTSQVVIGFKTSPKLKLLLAAESSENGTNIGNYVRNIVENRKFIKLVPLMSKEIEDLKRTIAVYETPEIKSILVKYTGKPVDFYENEIKKSKVINTIEDVYFVIMKSFKTNINAI